MGPKWAQNGAIVPKKALNETQMDTKFENVYLRPAKSSFFAMTVDILLVKLYKNDFVNLGVIPWVKGCTPDPRALILGEYFFYFQC